ncbi:MAG: hypothetical protein LBU53_09975 [Zoogloeaceae bacterium]|nr:hypothetical protein [Zoogloeaceae bacterium]
MSDNDTLTTPQPLSTEEVEQLHQAAEKLRHIFREQQIVELNYDEESVRWLDGYIERIRLKADEHQRQGHTNLIGSFLGECIIRNIGGQWARYDGMICIMHNKDNVDFPYNKVAKYYENRADSGDSILGFYQTIAAIRTLPLGSYQTIAAIRTPPVRKVYYLENASNHLKHGKQFIEVKYGKSRQKKEGYHFYSTSLKNISSQRIKIVQFGGYILNENKMWQLANASGGFYTLDDFKDWYQQKGEWLMPGETVCDATNWGTPPVLWAYHGITETGESFVAGRVLEKPMNTLRNILTNWIGKK